ncbi:MAG: NAD(P)-binding domain-containing protein, partial [Saprospiraceae bacterium]
EDTIEINTPEGHLTLPNNFVLAMTGYQPDFMFLEKIGITFTNDIEPELIYDEQTHQTVIPGLYVAGVVCGGMRTNKFTIENAREHAYKIITHLVEHV